MATRNRTMCQHFMRGTCRFGNNCWFSHDLPLINAARDATSDEYDVFASRITFLPSVNFGDASPIDGFPQYRTREPEQAQNSKNNQTESPQMLWNLKKNTSGEIKEGTPDAMLVEFEKKLKETENQVVKDQLMEKCVNDNLQCNICYELFIKPTVLNCSHTFCLVCIETWIKVVNQCPTCRVQIKSKANCSTLDTFIDTIAQLLSDEVKSKRETLKTERNNVQQTSQNQRNVGNPRRHHRRQSRDFLDGNVVFYEIKEDGTWNFFL